MKNIKKLYLFLLLLLTFSNRNLYSLYDNYEGQNFSYRCITGRAWGCGNFRNARMMSTSLSSVSFSFAELENVNFNSARLRSVILRCAHMTSANFTLANIKDSNFKGACLVSARFDRAKIENTTFEDADLRFTHLQNGDFHNVSFKNAKFNGFSYFYDYFVNGEYTKAAKVEGSDFEGAKGLSNEQKRFLREHGAINVPDDIDEELERLRQQMECLRCLRNTKRVCIFLGKVAILPYTIAKKLVEQCRKSRPVHEDGNLPAKDEKTD